MRNMSSANRSRKSKDIDSIQSEVRDIKKEMLKSSEKSLPTAEQMRIAEIIDTKTEDPTLKEKLKQVMDATQKSIDEAFIALHDCDNDPNRAVNMLLEGIGSEWSTSSKKKKNRTKEKPASTPEVSPTDVNRDISQNPKPFGNKQPTERRGRGRGFRGNRGDMSNSFTDRDRRDTNGPSRERGGRGRNQNRDFGRGRGAFRKPIETWDPYTPGDDSKGFEPDPDDWDNEEYTGSLANSLIITSSSTGNTPPPVNPSPYLNEKNSDSEIEKKPPPMETFIVKPSVSQSDLTPLAAVYYKQYTAAVNETALPVTLTLPPVRGNLVVTQDKNIRPSLPLTGQEIRQTRPPPKIPPPSKIPSGPVEMPPDTADNNIGLLDVQFGALELENSSETISPTPPHHTPSPTISDKQLHHQVGSPNEGLLLAEPSTTFSPVRSNTALPHIPELVTKVADVTSSLYQESSYQPPSSSSKTTLSANTSNFTSTYSSGQVNSTNSIIYSSNSNQNTYTSTGVYGGSSNSYPHYQYSAYPSQQAHTLQMLAGSSNSYQSVLGSQQYGSNTQTAYGASGLAPPVYPSQYQTYNSNIQHIYKQTMAPPSSTSSKEYDANQGTVNLTAISHTGSMSPTSTLLSASSSTTKPSSLSSSMGKSGMVTNLPPSVPALVGTHQYIMGQGTIPYFQQPMYYEDLQLMQQQRLAPHLGATGYYEMGYQTSGARDGYQYGMTDGRFARADTSSGTGSSTGHGASNSGVYGKMPTPFTANYGMYDSNQVRGNAGDFKSNQGLPKGVNPLSSSDSSALYQKSLPKVSAYEAQGYHGGPPMGSHPGLGPGDGYAQHVFIPTMTPHRAATLMHHQPIHQDGGLNPRSAAETQQNKVGITKTAY